MNLDPLQNYVKYHYKGEFPIKLEIKLEKIADKWNKDGDQRRYFRCYIDGTEVTMAVAEVLNRTISKAKDTNGCMIVHGCGMDMAHWIQNEIWSRFSYAGYKEMFDANEYKYLGYSRG